MSFHVLTGDSKSLPKSLPCDLVDLLPFVPLVHKNRPLEIDSGASFNFKIITSRKWNGHLAVCFCAFCQADVVVQELTPLPNLSTRGSLAVSVVKQNRRKMYYLREEIKHTHHIQKAIGVDYVNVVTVVVRLCADCVADQPRIGTLVHTFSTGVLR